MSFVLRSHHDRYRQRNRESLVRSLIICSVIIVTFMLGYYAANKKNEQDARLIQMHNNDLKLQTEQTEQTRTNLEAQYQTLLIQYQQLAAKYKRDLPQGELADLVQLVKEQLEKGLPAKRLAQIIQSTQPPKNCTDPVNKRFILSTPVYKGPQSAVTFADGAITVTGTGEPSINNKRNKEAWFDPGKPVNIVFQMVGGKREEKSGLLPLQHTIIMQNREYRFRISEGPRSFIVITNDSCDSPEIAAPQRVINPVLTNEPQNAETPEDASEAR